MNSRFFKILGISLIAALASTNVYSQEENNSIIVELKDSSRSSIQRLTRAVKKYGVKEISYTFGSPLSVEDERSKRIDKGLKLIRGRSISKKLKQQIISQVSKDLEIQTLFVENLKRSETKIVRPQAKYITLTFRSNQKLSEAKEVIQKNLNLNVSDNLKIESQSLPNEPFVDRNQDGQWDINPQTGMPFSWGLQRVRGVEASSKHSATGAGIIVAVIDAGVDIQNNDISSNLHYNTKEIRGNNRDDDFNGIVDDYIGYDFLAEKAGSCLINGRNTCGNGYTGRLDIHGTAVASVIASASNNFGTLGVARNAKIMPLRVLGYERSPVDNKYVNGDIGLTARAIRYAADNGASVINLSLGMTIKNPSNPESAAIISLITNAVNYANSRGVIVVASAGNGEKDSSGRSSGVDSSVVFPASIPNVISVAATGYDNNLTSFSNFGRLTDIAAPGFDIIVSPAKCLYGCYLEIDGFNPEYFDGLNGTSFSSPIVAGAIALILEKKPNLRQSEIEQALYSTSFPLGFSSGKTIRSGSGILNIEAALDKVNPPQLPVNLPSGNMCTNNKCATDINNDGVITPLDALLVINALNNKSGNSSTACTDVNRDGILTPLDALIVINKLNSGNPSC